jgi:adenylyltransferase/sulfurtransferase
MTIHIAPLGDERYARMRAISWWEQERLARSTVLVAGAGALGNEALKNLALLGVGCLVVIDLDRIECSNLTRSVLFRRHDVGREKAIVACERVRELNPDVTAIPIVGDLRFDLGLGIVRRADVVLGCLDGREARYLLGRACFRTATPYVDAALDHLNGDVTTFLAPAGPCYECTLGAAAKADLRRRQSCLKLARAEGSGGHVPTAPTSAAIAAGLQSQIAVRLLHGLPVPAGRRLGSYGLSDVHFDIRLEMDEDCATHGYVECLEGLPSTPVPLAAEASSLDETLAAARALLGEAASISLDDDRDLLVALECPPCGISRPARGPVQAFAESEARCPSCGATMAPRCALSLEEGSALGPLRLREIGIPPLHLLRVQGASGAEVLLELAGDEGPLGWPAWGRALPAGPEE